MGLSKCLFLCLFNCVVVGQIKSFIFVTDWLKLVKSCLSCGWTAKNCKRYLLNWWGFPNPDLSWCLIGPDSPSSSSHWIVSSQLQNIQLNCVTSLEEIVHEKFKANQLEEFAYLLAAPLGRIQTRPDLCQQRICLPSTLAEKHMISFLFRHCHYRRTYVLVNTFSSRSLFSKHSPVGQYFVWLLLKMTRLSVHSRKRPLLALSTIHSLATGGIFQNGVSKQFDIANVIGFSWPSRSSCLPR